MPKVTTKDGKREIGQISGGVGLAMTRCVSIPQAGGYEQLTITHQAQPTSGPNLEMNNIPDNECVTIATSAAGVNYADVCIRWGLYTSAKKFVGWPITPGFEFAGEVVTCGTAVDGFAVGDKVFGVSLFGGYSTHVKIPASQCFKLPKDLTETEAAGFPSVAMTAWMAMDLVNMRPGQTVLVHSAAGGVGSMLVQIGKIKQLKVVGVVGASHKVGLCQSIGCNHVIDKSKEDLWARAKEYAPDGYDAVFDANGVATLNQSYEHLGALGKLCVYGFHTMLPKQGGRLGVTQWLKMAYDYIMTPRFNPLDMVPVNKSVLAFNLSFLFDKKDLCKEAMDELLGWVKEGKLRVPKVTTYPLADVGKAHSDIESGQTTGKLVLLTQE
jgi:NADPH:quinone reductase-like Zn-dependent oxidoreductase